MYVPVLGGTTRANPVDQVAKYLNPIIIGLDQAPDAFRQFMGGAAHKFFVDPNGLLAEAGFRPTTHA
jgi:hypothetical protein